MKKFFLLFALCLTIGAAKLSAVDNLYVYGNAMGDGIASDICSWNTDKAPLMYAEGNDVFTFTAYFAAGDTEFKFITTPNGDVTYYNAAGKTDVLDVEQGGTLTTDKAAGDNKFKMAEAGWYKITCDLQALTIRAEKKDNGDEQPIRYQHLFMVGNATPGGWTESNGYRMDYQGGRLYAADVYLGEGTFKVALNQAKGFDYNYYFFRDATDANKVSRDGTDDRQWSVSASGTYRVAIDLADNSISIAKQDFGGNLYMVGDAVSGGWDLNNVPMMNQDGNVFTYTGWIEAHKEFKFLTVRDFGWDNVMQLVNAAGETGYLTDGQAGLKAAVNVKENGAEVNDDKFKLPAESGSGNYRVTCDLNAMTVKVEKVTYQDTHIQHAALYMVGTATPDNEQAETFPEKAVKLVSNEDNTYSAQGVELKEGVFKLLTACDLGWSTTHLHRDAADDGKISTDGTDDRKWTISEAGVYDITANLADSTITITKQEEGPGTGTVQVEANGVRVLQAGRAIEVLLPDGVTACFDLYDLSGKHVAGLAGMSGCAVLGGELTPGIYALRVAVGGRVQVQKILVR